MKEKQIINYYPSGIYAIHNITKDIFYIGSSENIEKRWKQHQAALKKGNHYNKRLQKDFNEGDIIIYGLIKDAFPDHRQLYYEERFITNRFKEKHIKLYNEAEILNSSYMSSQHVKDLICDKYLMERFGKTYNQLFAYYNPVNSAMYYDIIKNDVEKEKEIRKEYKPLLTYFNKFWYAACKHQII